jgi:hypothetical protein
MIDVHGLVTAITGYMDQSWRQIFIDEKPCRPHAPLDCLSGAALPETAERGCARA